MSSRSRCSRRSTPSGSRSASTRRSCCAASSSATRSSGASSGRPVPRSELPALLAGAHALVSATQPHGSETLDKVVYEASACAVPVVASNAALGEFLSGLSVELLFPPRDHVALAERLTALAAAGRDARAEAGAELRRRVVAGHSLDSWADAVAATVSGQGQE